MTGLEAMAAWLGRRTHGEEWADLDARTRASMIEDARELLGLYEAKRWRVPTEEDCLEPMLHIVWLNEGEKAWSGPWSGSLAQLAIWFGRMPILVADPLPLPPAPGGGE